MNTKKLAYFDVTAELFLEIIKPRTNLPQDTTVYHVESNPNWQESFGVDNIIRIYAQSDSFEPVMEGQTLPKLDVMAENHPDEQHGVGPYGPMV